MGEWTMHIEMKNGDCYNVFKRSNDTFDVHKADNIVGKSFGTKVGNCETAEQVLLLVMADSGSTVENFKR